MSKKKANNILSKESAERLRSFAQVSKIVVSDTTRAAKPLPFFIRTHEAEIGAKSLTQDGVDHINISKDAKTPIGTLFSQRNQLPYFDSVVGFQIISLDGYFRYLYDGMEEAFLLTRKLTGAEYSQMRAKEKSRNRIRNLSILKAHGLYEKIKSYPELCEILKGVQVPFDSYLITETNSRYRTSDGVVLAMALNLIKAALIKGEEPDFSIFLDRDSRGDVGSKLLSGLKTSASRSVIRTELEPMIKHLTELGAPKAPTFAQTLQAAEKAVRERSAQQKQKHPPKQKTKANRPESLNQVIPSAPVHPAAAPAPAPTSATDPTQLQSISNGYDLVSGIVPGIASGSQNLIPAASTPKQLEIAPTNTAMQIDIGSMDTQVDND